MFRVNLGMWPLKSIVLEKWPKTCTLNLQLLHNTKRPTKLSGHMKMIDPQRELLHRCNTMLPSILLVFQFFCVPSGLSELRSKPLLSVIIYVEYADMLIVIKYRFNYFNDWQCTHCQCPITGHWCIFIRCWEPWPWGLSNVLMHVSQCLQAATLHRALYIYLLFHP